MNDNAPGDELVTPLILCRSAHFAHGFPHFCTGCPVSKLGGAALAVFSGPASWRLLDLHATDLAWRCRRSRRPLLGGSPADIRAEAPVTAFARLDNRGAAGLADCEYIHQAPQVQAIRYQSRRAARFLLARTPIRR